MDNRKVTKIVKAFSELVRNEIPVDYIVLYGSYAKGTATENSDIDVAVIVDKIKGDSLNVESMLFRLRRQIDSRIEPVLLTKKDNISGFVSEVFRTGKIIYKKAA